MWHQKCFFPLTTILYSSIYREYGKYIIFYYFEPQTMKYKKSQFKKFTFNLPVSKSPSIPLSLSSLRDITSDLSMSNIDYAERVAQIANIVVILILRVRYKNNSYLRETQENLIESSLQTSLSYILL